MDFIGAPAPAAAELSTLSARDMSASLATRLRYAARPGGAVKLRPLTYWLVADLGTEEGRRMLHDALLQAVRILGGAVGTGQRLGWRVCVVCFNKDPFILR